MINFDIQLTTGEAASLFIVVIFKSSLKLVWGPAIYHQKAKKPPQLEADWRKLALSKFEVCPHQESDLDLLVRSELFYPLNYKGKIDIIIAENGLFSIINACIIDLNY